MNALTDELREVEAQLGRLEERKRELYRKSVEAAENEKICQDSLATLLGEPEIFRTLEYPVSINGITFSGELFAPGRIKPGALVKVRPCEEEFENKTLLGLYLGDYAQSVGCSRNAKTGILEVYVAGHNPTIWIPSRERVVYGCNSYWGLIQTIDQLTEISNEVIDGLFYVQALKTLAGEQTHVKR